MNVVWEQLKKKYKVPKDVMHYIVHLFRPRAPEFAQEPWLPWTNGSWYNYNIDPQSHMLYKRHTRLKICQLCLKEIPFYTPYGRMCEDCNLAYNKAWLKHQNHSQI